MRPRAFSLVELVTTLVLSGAVVVLALFTTVVAVRAAQRATVHRALSAEAEVVSLLLLEDLVRLGTQGTADDVALAMPDGRVLFTLAARIDHDGSDDDVASGGPGGMASTWARVSWGRDGRALTREECPVVDEADDGTLVYATSPSAGCARVVMSPRVRRFEVTPLDDTGARVDAARATRLAFALVLAASEAEDAITVSVVDEARLGGLP